MEKKVNQRVLLTKRLVEEGLLRLLAKEPIETINVSELCREAGINRATFYKHYYSPHAVLAEIESNVAKELENAQYALLPKESATTISKIEGICSYLKKNANTIKILVKSKMDSDISKVFERVPNDALYLIEHNTRIEDKNKQLVACFLSFGLYSLIVKWITEDIPLTPREIATLIEDLSRHGWAY